MKSLVLGSILAIAMTACVGPASDPPPPTSQPALDDPARANPSDVRPLEPAARATAPTGDGHPPLDNLTGTTWQEQTVEMCFDWFLTFCTSSFPSPQCPAAPAGQPCSPAGAVCYKTLTKLTFRYYQCE